MLLRPGLRYWKRRDDIPEDVLHGEQSRGVDVEHGIKPGVPVAYCIEKADRCDGSFGKRKHNLYQDLCIICSIDNSRLLQALGNPVEEFLMIRRFQVLIKQGRTIAQRESIRPTPLTRMNVGIIPPENNMVKNTKPVRKSPSF